MNPNLGRQWRDFHVDPFSNEYADHGGEESSRSKKTATEVVSDALWASPVGPQGPDVVSGLQGAMRDLMKQKPGKGYRAPRGGQFDTRRTAADMSRN